MTASDIERASGTIRGPYPIRLTDIDAVNRVFSDAFTERYRKDGMPGVRVPFLNPAIWRFAIEDARDGAMLWRDERGDVVAFNVAHLSGVEGWMGPLAVRPEWQGTGLGKSVVRAGIEWLKASSAEVIGLETMPRTMDNIGFYSGLGFLPGHLTITVTVEGSPTARPGLLLSGLAMQARDEVLAECRALTQRLLPGFDYTREVELTLALALGDVMILRDGGVVQGFALFHAAPLVEGRAREELRVLKLVLRDEAAGPRLAEALSASAVAVGARRAAVRVQANYGELYHHLLKAGGRVRWTDLRMSLREFRERQAERGVVLSNWEI
jgi:GNAT superfamily N-acetyltransferase